MIAFVINLDSRPDRLVSALDQANYLGVPLIRVEAVTTQSICEADLRFAAPGVAATWLSHKKAAAEFLQTDNDYALILEDDFVLKRNFKLPTESWLTQTGVDFLQIGFLRVTKWEAVDILFINFRDSILRFIQVVSRISSKFNATLTSRLLIRELPTSPIKLVPSDIRPGGHCYLISRKFAQSMQELNNPIIFSADELFVSISKMRAFKMMRFKRSASKQSNSPSSVTIRFKQS